MTVGLCRGRVRGPVHTEARWKDAKRTGGNRLGMQQGCCKGVTQLSVSKLVCSARALLCGAPDHLHFRECKSLSLPEQDKKSSQLCPRTPQGGDLGTHSFEGHRNALTFTDFHACTSQLSQK